MMKQILNTQKEYVVVRVQLVHVKKRFFGYQDKILAFHTAIPDTANEALELHEKIGKLMEKYGVTVEC